MTASNLLPKPQPNLPYTWDDEGVTNPEVPHLVLVVDDSAMQRKMLTKALIKWGYEVMEADNALAGLEICRSHDVTMVISDWIMPGMNGPQFCHAFRQLDRFGYGYFILLTSKGESREVAEGLNSGADDFLTKPFIFGELKARLRAGERIVEMHAQLIQKNRVVNNALDTIQSLYDNVQRDLSEARRLQQSLVRETSVPYIGGHATLMLHPSGHIGGDLVGQFSANNSKIGLYSLDVSGHGVASALMTARLAGYLSGYSPSQNIALVDRGGGDFDLRDPGQTAGQLNEILLQEMNTDLYFTLALACIDLATGHTSCVQAGHPHPLHMCHDGTLIKRGTGGMPVGLLPDAKFETFEFTLSPGDRLVLHSDGLTEAEDASGTQLDDEGLGKILRSRKSLRRGAFLDNVYAQLAAFNGGGDFEDDVSALVFEYDGPSTKEPSC